MSPLFFNHTNVDKIFNSQAFNTIIAGINFYLNTVFMA
jgi:hypothetical protein